MAPETKNTHRVSLDTLAALKSLFGSVSHAYSALQLAAAGIETRRFRLAFSHYRVTFEEMTTIETAWERWQEYFLAADAGDYTKLMRAAESVNALGTPHGQIIVDKVPATAAYGPPALPPRLTDFTLPDELVPRQRVASLAAHRRTVTAAHTLTTAAGNRQPLTIRPDEFEDDDA